MSEPKTVVFDLDGTLIDTAGDLTQALNHVLRGQRLPEVAASEARTRISFGAMALIEFGYAEAGVPLPDRNVMKTLFDRFIAYYEENISVESRPFDGVWDALDRLRDAGWTLAICTNKREALSKRLLTALDLDERFAAICGSDTFAVRKPHPDHLRLTIAQTGGTPRRAVMVGDAEPDIGAAKAAGVPVIGLDFGYSSVPMADLEPDAILSHYDDLVRQVEGFEQAFA